jgi:hypothetical protein
MADFMVGLDIAGRVLDGAEKVASLARQAIEAFQNNDDSKALELLNEAISHYEAGAPGARAELEAVKARVQTRIDGRFPPGGSSER